MATKRRKATPATAPSTLPEAIDRITRYVEIDTGLEKLAADAKEAVAKVRAVHDATAKPLQQELKALYDELRIWWAVAGPAVVEGDGKSADLAGCKLGLRLTPPRLKNENVSTEAEAAALLAAEGERFNGFIRIEIALDKPAIHAALRDPDTPLAKDLARLGFVAIQREEFFIARPETLPAVETIAEPQQEAA